MKVLNVNHLLDPETGGGTAERSFQLSRFLDRAGANCTVLTLDIGMTPQRITALEGIRVVALPCLNRRYFVPQVSSRVLDRLVAAADVIHLSGHWTVLNALVHGACRRQGRPYAFCPAGALKPFGRSLALKRLYDAVVGRRIAHAAAACVAITEEERADFAAYGVAPERVTVIPNGIDPDQYELRDVAGAEERCRSRIGIDSSPYVLFLGRLNEIKGPDLLLEAFFRVTQRFPDLHLVFAGPDGGMMDRLRAQCDERGLAAKVHFTGYIGGDEKAAALRDATLLAIPSRREAMSIVVLEAGICGTPVLFTDACGLDDVARAGAGTMAQVSAEALAAALSSALSNRPALRAGAERLNALVRERYLWRIQAARYIALYERLLAGSA